ncbi:MAG: glycoside hydrolase family 95 protein [Roseburia sp.]|nr:glycoside hydrolase family 95 protein [Roseburia sp.]MCM1096558.1 glycoside hydrolase family 95 protein [Ruminococcus flavefaciens]
MITGDRKRELWYRKPAEEWEEALPIGNGRLGAMVYGKTDTELLQVNEESIWYGGKAERLNPDFRENLPKIREYLDQGKIREAERLMDQAMSGCPDSMHPYQTLGEIKFSFSGIDPKKATDYRRSLDLNRALALTEFREGDTVYRREIFASAPADCVVMRFTAEGSGTVDFTVRLRRGKFFDGVGRQGEDGIELYGSLGRGGFEYAMALRAQAATGGRIRAVGECLIAEGAKEVVLCFTADTTWHYSTEEQNEWVKGYLATYNAAAGTGAGIAQGNSESGLLSDSRKGNHFDSEQGSDRQNTNAPDSDHREGNYSEAGTCDRLGACPSEFCPAERHFLSLAAREGIPEYERQEYLFQAALQGQLHLRIAERLEKGLDFGWERLRKEHIEDYGGLFRRFSFELDGAEIFDGKPTDERLEAAKEGKADPGLSELLLAFGRYLTIACSRPGGLPATLQGLWNKDFQPPWDSKYTININTEMNYWHVESCNLSECHLPLFDLLERVRETGRRTAREMYGCRGFVAHHNTDIHGDSAPQDIWYPGSYWAMGGAWLSTHLWMHYQYTRDEKFLRKAFPVLAEAALFFVDFLIERDGYLVTSPSVSPENRYRLPGGESGSCCVGATMDNQILRHLFTACLDAWKALGGREPEGCRIPDVESIPGLTKRIEDCKNRLRPTRISESGRIMEWQEDYEEADPGHRHISHLYGLYPGGEITADGTPELAAAARKTLECRLAHGGGHTGWSRAWIMNHYASLWDGEEAYANIEKMLGQSTYPNLFDRHPPFQIDGNFGACAAISGMLAQSSEERVVLLPALPRAWADGSVRGLRLVGNAELSMEWKNGKLVRAEISAGSDYDTNVIYGERKFRVTLKGGEDSLDGICAVVDESAQSAK